MNEADLQALVSMVAKAVHNEDSFGKVYGTIVPFFSALLGGLITVAGQLYVARKQRAHEKKNSEEDSEEKARRAENELKMWNIASQRKARAKVAQMRQVRINNLRKDGAAYLTLWQEIAYRWHAMISDASSKDLSDAEKNQRFERFLTATPKLRQMPLNFGCEFSFT
jgi:ATPase subunit of ABC transporter with duplicated ATPase domains